MRVSLVRCARQACEPVLDLGSHRCEVMNAHLLVSAEVLEHRCAPGVDVDQERVTVHAGEATVDRLSLAYRGSPPRLPRPWAGHMIDARSAQRQPSASGDGAGRDRASESRGPGSPGELVRLSTRVVR